MVGWYRCCKSVCGEGKVVFFWDVSYGVYKCGDGILCCFVWDL